MTRFIGQSGYGRMFFFSRVTINGTVLVRTPIYSLFLARLFSRHGRSEVDLHPEVDREWNYGPSHFLLKKIKLNNKEVFYEILSVCV